MNILQLQEENFESPFSFSFIISLLLLLCSDGQTLAAPKTSPLNSSEERYQQQRVINQTLLRDAQKKEQLKRFKQLLEEEKLVPAAALFQELMEHHYDSFTWNDAGETVSVKAFACRLFELSPRLWPVYSQVYSGAAKDIYDPQNPETWRETCHRYFFTDSGFRAQKKLAAKDWQEGKFTQAADRLLRMIESEVHHSKLTEKLILQTSFACELSHTDSLISRFRKACSQIETDAPPSSKLKGMFAEVQSHLEQIDARKKHPWKTPRQLEYGNKYTKGSLPMSEPSWVYQRQFGSSETVCPESEARFKQSLQQWSTSQREHLFPEVSSQFAVHASVGTM